MEIKNKTQILNDDQVKEMARYLMDILPPGAEHFLAKGSVDPEVTVRMLSMSQKFQEERERTGKSIKEAAKALNVPQYRVRAIEAGRVGEILPEILRAYSRLLGIDEWCLLWAKRNNALAGKLGIVEWEGE